MGNAPRLIEKKVFGVQNRSDSIFVNDNGPSQGRQQACFNLGWEQSKASLHPDPIGDGINIGIMGCNREPYNESYAAGFKFGKGMK